MLPDPLVIALPIADRARAHRFYTEGLGLSAHGKVGDDDVPEPLQIRVNDGVHLMLIPAAGFAWTIPGRTVADSSTSECQLSVMLADEQEVNEFVQRARDAGAEVLTEPQTRPWGYGANFADPDGHVWMILAEPN